MKILKYLFAVAALGFATLSCEVISEDAFSTLPVPPEMYAHSNILMTSNTMDEYVNFSWKPARFLSEGVNYNLYAKYGNTSKMIYSTKEYFYSAPKTQFKDALYAAFPNLPDNDTFSMSFYVSVPFGIATYTSEEISVDIYAYGDAVSAEVSAVQSSIVLDITNPAGVLELLTWTPARLEYNEAITYSVHLKYGTGEYMMLASDITETSFSMTVDALNEAAVAAGAPEAQQAEVEFAVKAHSATYESGVISAVVPVLLTTYIATYPDFLYLPGSYKLNNWDPATAPKIAQSTVKKGYYEGVVDLSTADGSNTQFKFSPKPAWDGDFAIDNIVLSTFGNGYTSVSGTGTTGGNLEVPSGMYNIIVNKKLNTLYMIQIDKLSLIGSAPVASNGWANDVDMEYDPVSHTFSAVADMVAGEFKIRVNHDWTHSAGGQINKISFNPGDNNNITFSRPDGNYKVVLNVSANPYTITYINTSFPEKLYMPGDHQGWNPASAPFLRGDNEGHYEGYTTLNANFKFTSAPDWNHTNYGGSLASLNADSGAGNLTVPAPGYYYLYVDLTTMSGSATLIERVGVVGSFCNWGDPSDAAMTYYATDDIWKAEGLEFPEGTKYKFRMNSGWTINLGGQPNDLVQDGGDMAAPSAGVYTITLSIATKPYTMTITRTGDLQTQYATELVVAGDYSGHNWSGTDDPKLFGSGDGTYKGAITMHQMTWGFKFVEKGTSWIGGTLNEGTTYDFTLYKDDNMMLPNGTYFWSVDLPAKTAHAQPVTSVGLIGSFTGSGWSTDVPMTFSETSLTYSVTQAFAAGDEFKVRFNGNWDYNLGAPLSAMKFNGDNIKISEAGTYLVVLDMANTPNMTITKQ